VCYKDATAQYLKGHPAVSCQPGLGGILGHWHENVSQPATLAAASEKKILGLGNIEASSTGDLESHLTIRVGKDWDNQIHG